MGNKIRHILSISGGKDSAALAIYLRDKIPEMEYVFYDTGKELPETYEYLNRIENYLGKQIVRLNSEYDFDHWLEVFGGFLPSARMRWCTKLLKLKPFEHYCADDSVYSYVAIRADEDREGYISTRPNIKPLYPFKDEGICYEDVIQILEEAGVGLPSYYTWRSRSGCYFCFFQQKIEWVGLLENHPERFKDAMDYEKTDESTSRRFTWCDNESLEELARPERIKAIKEEYKRRMERSDRRSGKLVEILEDDEGPQPCLICTL
jgi:hypothetical protein